MYQYPKRFFVREFLLMLAAFSGIVLLAVFSNGGGTAVIIVLLLNAIIMIVLFVMFILSIVFTIKRLTDKDIKQSPIMYFVNIVFSFLVLAGFFIFYLVLVISGIAILGSLVQ